MVCVGTRPHEAKSVSSPTLWMTLSYSYYPPMVEKQYVRMISIAKHLLNRYINAAVRVQSDQHHGEPILMT